MKFIAIITSVFVVLTSTALAQSPKGAEQLRSQGAKMEKSPKQVSSVVSPKSRLTYSVNSRGFIRNPKTGEVTGELVTLRERGFWGNGCLTQLLLDDEGRPLAVLNTSSSAGPGNAIIQGASFVGGMYVFANHLRPNKQTVNGGDANSDSSSTSKGGNADANASNKNSNSNSNVNVNANTSTSTSTSTATGGNGNGHVPPGHQPGHGQPGHGND